MKSSGGHSDGSLPASDRKLLNAALQAGRSFEQSFNHENEVRFRDSLLACSAADSILVKKLSELAPKVSFELGPRHLMGLLVPLERLAGRSARDEEFLYLEHDGEPGAKAVAAKDHGINHQRIVLCENIRSAFNVGAIFRTAETFGAGEVWLGGYTPDPLKTAMGTDALVASKRFDRVSDAIAEAKENGYSVVALENSHGATPLGQFNWPAKTLLVLGNERFGVDSQTLESCDHIVRIATVGQKNSLNVGIAFGVAASHWCESETESELEPASNPNRENLSPIGFLRGGYKNSQVAPRQGAYSSDSTLEPPVATIELESRFEGRPSNFEQALKDLDGFERAWIIFGFHESQSWLPQVRPPRGDGTKRGLFATRSPHRPNRLGVSSVRIEKVENENRRVFIREHDLLEGTPIYDIKPYVAGADAFPDARGGWVDEVEKSAFTIVEGTAAHRKIDQLEAAGETRIRGFIEEQLRFQPLDSDRKRLELIGSGDQSSHGPHHTISFRTWRIDFRIIKTQLEILDVRSGYSEVEMLDPSDPYGDKDLHRKVRPT